MEQVKYPKRVLQKRAPGMTSYKLSKIVAGLHLKRSQTKVLRALADRYPNIYASVDKLAEEARYNPTVTREALRALESFGLIYEILSPLGKSRKKGGRHCSVQYGINVSKVLELAEYPTVSEENPPDSEKYPTVSDAKPTGKRWGTENITEKNNREEITEKYERGISDDQDGAQFTDEGSRQEYQLPLAEMRQAVLDASGHEVWFPRKDHRQYLELIREFGRGALLRALQDCCNSCNGTFNWRGFSGYFLSPGAGRIILLANAGIGSIGDRICQIVDCQRPAENGYHCMQHQPELEFIPATQGDGVSPQIAGCSPS